MASIESLGLGSGVLTTDLVEQIIGAEREVSELRLDRRQELIEAKDPQAKLLEERGML